MELYKRVINEEIVEPDVAPIIKPSRPKPKKLPEEWDIKKPKISPMPKGNF